MKTMAEVLAEHQYDRERAVCMCSELVQVGLRCDPQTHPEHVAEVLTAAGFGPVQEAAAAGVRSIYDIWGSGGRRTVRMDEIHKADETILSGEWDNHIAWNMGDIRREHERRARDSVIESKGRTEDE